MTKKCNRCSQEKELNRFSKDYRREGMDSMYQQPCIDCRNAQKRNKRFLDFANNVITDGRVSYHHLRRNSTGLKKEDVTKELIDFYKEYLFLKREIRSFDESVIYENGKIACLSCRMFVILQKTSKLSILEKQLQVFKETHSSCYKKDIHTEI
jgi:hypothetical protein